jgi:hypothetical protein
MAASDPAYPSHPVDNRLPHRGLSKRELFAAMAMQGILNQPGNHNELQTANDAVAYADALIKRLEKP